MEDFCGSKFWDLDLTWYTETPDFTRCFENTVLSWIPCAFLWLTAGFDVLYALRSKRPEIPNSSLNMFQRFLTLALLILEVFNFAYSFRTSPDRSFNVYDADRWTPLVKAITFVLALALQFLNRRKGISSSGILFIFWLLVVVCGVFRYQTEIRALPIDEENEHAYFWFIILMISYPVSVVQLLIHFFSDVPPSDIALVADENGNELKRLPSREATASFPSRITFQWFWPLAYLGYKKPLEFKDLWDLNPEDKSRAVVDHFNKFWRSETAKTRASKFQSGPKQDTEEGSKKSGVKGASILSPLWKANWDLFFLGVILKLVHDVLLFVAPYLLDLLIAQVGAESEQWKGYFYAGLLFTVVMIQTLFLSQYFHKMFIVGMRIRSALVGAIFRKSLLISNAARKESTLGEIVNLMSVDSQRFVDLTAYINMIWSAPLQIILSLYFLWETLGPSVLAGVGIMILLIPINIFIANRVKGFQIRQMKNKDERVKLMNEILSGIKVLKLYAWEPSFEEQINNIRRRELNILKKSAYLQSVSMFVWLTAPFLVSLVTFGTYVLIDDENILDARKAFVSLSYFNIMRSPMSILPNILVFLVEAGVSLKRVNKFLNAKEVNPDDVTHDKDPDDKVVKVNDGTFGWDDDVTLRDINLEVKKGSLIAVVGTVGSGKTSLLSAILGEMQKISGRINTYGSVAYVAQQAWIQNATLRNNVLFGLPYDPKKYDKVIEACALKPDLKILPGGDRTEIGEKGINLSGGQKQRVSLARATYNDADIYLLDDPLSAVDSHVGKHLFDKVIGPSGILKGKTRIIVTHGVTYLPKVDHIVVMTGGKITETGTFNELLQKKGAFADFLIQHAGAEDLEAADPSTVESLEKAIGPQVLERQRSRISESEKDMGRRMSTISTSSRKSALEEDAKLERQQSLLKGKDGKEKLIEVETVETGEVKRDVYAHYLQSVSMTYAVVSIALLIAMTGFSMGSSIWLSEWTQSAQNSSQSVEKRDLYLGVYGAFGLGQAVSALLGNAIMALGCLRAAKFLHEHMLTNILRSPMSFFDTTPLGRIVNRFSKDVDVADSTFPANLKSWITCLLQVLSTFFIISYSTPWFIVVIVPLGIIYYAVQRFYVASSRQLKRLESQSRSPIYSHFSETLTGTMTIRAFAVQNQFILQSEHTVDHNQLSYYPSIIANRWLAVRLETVGNLIILFSALLAVISDNNEGSLGLSVSYALSITQTLNWLVRMTSDVETNVVAVERIKEYGEVPKEAAWEVEGKKPSPNWPEEGTVTFKGYQTRYREGLDLVLRGISCKIDPGEKIGIVGRTGAGKSSLTLGLFRIIEAAGGSIEIDGQTLADLGLHDVRGKLTIIPQDPVLFSGTLRMNLDPFGKYSDNEVWHALEYAHLKSFVNSLPSGLEHKVSEGGENLSVGQRQLVCLARALLRKTKILILDEATAAVDLETDDLIQETIRTEFKECTVLTIAHRLNTILDSNRVMVLDKGEIREFKSPQELLADKHSIFYGMAKDAGLV